MRRPSSQALLYLGLLAAGALGALLLHFQHPSFYGIPRCPFRSLTGLLCPGCGSLRSLHHLFQGHIVTAFRFNPLTISLLPFLAVTIAHQTLWHLRLVSKPALSPAPWAGWLLLAGIVTFGVGRNLGLWGW